MSPDSHDSTRFSLLSAVLSQAIKDLNLEGPIYQQKIWEVWEEAVGKAVAKAAQPDRVRFKTLFVRVVDSVWLHHLARLQGLILEKVNRKVGRKVIEKIYFRLGEIGPPPDLSSMADGAPAGSPSEGEILRRTLPGLTQEEIEDYLRPIQDDQLRAILRRMLSRLVPDHANPDPAMPDPKGGLHPGRRGI